MGLSPSVDTPRMRFLFEGHVLDIDRRELRRGDEQVPLEPLVFDLLAYLLANRAHVSSKDDVLDSVWAGRIVSESALTTRIAAARQAIGDSGDRQKLIRTIARKGFRFVGEVHEEGSSAQPPPQPARMAAAPFLPAPAMGLPDKPSIVVLPFANLSGEPEQEFFADCIVDDIINDLSHDRSLFVIARNSSFTYKGRAVDVKLAGRELGVRYVLEGSTRRNGNRIRVNVLLIEAETGDHLWGERYDRDVENVFIVQDEITAAVASAINPAISHAERRRATQKPAESLSAWEAWHTALGFISTRDVSGLRNFLQLAVTLDPRFAAAHAMLAFLYVAEATRGQHPPLPESSEMAVAAARQAIRLDPRSATAHAMLAWAFGHQGDWEPALAEADAAIILNANDPWGYLSKGHNLIYYGNPAAAREPLATALRLDPRGPTALTAAHQCAVGCYFERDYNGAEDVARRAIRDYPENPRPHLAFAASLGQLGRTDEAQAALQVAITASPSIFRFITDSRPHYYRPEDHAHLLDGLRKAGWAGGPGNAPITVNRS